MAHRCAVALARGKHVDELAGFAARPGPREEFVEIARSVGGPLLSFTSEAARHGRWFTRLFASRPWYGSAVGIAMRSNEFDRLYVTGEDVAFPLAALLKLRRWRGRIVCRVHNMTPKKARFLRWIGHGIFAALITSSAEQQRLLVTEHGIPPEKAITVAKWVDDSFFHPAASKPARTRPRVVACGAENRDYATLAAAARGCEADFAVYGHGFFGENASRFDSQGLPGNMTLMPKVPFEELAREYAEADLIVLPVNNVPYAAGVTGLVEAMASGQAVVVSRTIGLSEYFGALPPERLAEPHDPAALRTAIERALAEPDRLATEGRRNREWAEANASLGRYVDRVASLMLR